MGKFIDLTGQKFGKLTALEYKGNNCWVCKCDCGNIIEANGQRLRVGDIVQCKQCKMNFESIEELDIYDDILNISSYEIERKVRDLIPPYEIDMYIPDIKLAIEYNGCYWHSIEAGKDEKYHRLKTELCAKKGIQLFQIFEYEILQPNNIISQLKNIIENSNIIYNIEVNKQNNTITCNKEVIAVINNNSNIYIKSYNFNEATLKIIIDTIRKQYGNYKIVCDLSKCNIQWFLNAGCKVANLIDPQPIYFDTNKKEIVESKYNKKVYTIYNCGYTVFKI